MRLRGFWEHGDVRPGEGIYCTAEGRVLGEVSVDDIAMNWHSIILKILFPWLHKIDFIWGQIFTYSIEACATLPCAFAEYLWWGWVILVYLAIK